jgi:hypothetical protein
MAATADTPNHDAVCGACAESCRNAIASMPSIAPSTISASNPYVRASAQMLLTC